MIEVHPFLRESPRTEARATELNSVDCQQRFKPVFEQDYGLFLISDWTVSVTNWMAFNSSFLKQGHFERPGRVSNQRPTSD
jgi:hypothetical protein